MASDETRNVDGPDESEKAPKAPVAEPGNPESASVKAPEEADVSPEADANPEDGTDAAGSGDPEAKAGVKEGSDRRAGRHAKTRVPSTGIVHVKATFSNTMVTITDARGAVVSWSSGGRAGFKGSRKSTAFAATIVGQEAARQAVGLGMREVEVRVQGAGAGRESAVRALQASGMTVTGIKDVTPVPHNGCRPRKRRRV